MSRYQIRCDGFVFADNLQKEYSFFDAVLDEKINTAGTLTFSVLAQNPRLPDVKLMLSIISVFREGEEIWRGRIINVERDFYNRRKITCEGALAFLSDTRQQTFKANNATPTSQVNYLLNAYNALCTPTRQLQIGTIEPTTPITYDHTNEYLTFFEVFAEILSIAGGYYQIRYNNGTAYLDWLNMPTEPYGQEIVFGQNLLDITRYVDASTVITGLYATGPSNIALKNPIVNNDYAALFGLVYGFEHFDNVSSQDQLTTVATDFLNKNVLYNTTITISAADLNLVDNSKMPFVIGQLVRVSSPPHNLATNILLSGLTTNLSNPAASLISLGDTRTGFTKYVTTSIKKGGIEVYRYFENAYGEGVNSI